MFRKYGRCFWASILMGLALSAGAAAQTFNESGDAGQTLATAQAVPPGTTTIKGNLQTEGDVDLYRFTLSASGSITIRGYGDEASETCRIIDANLILFNSAGLPLWGNDDGYDATICLGSEIVLNLPAGTYYLAFGDNNIEAMNSSNVEICSNDDGDCSAGTTPLSYFESSGDDTGPYTITFSRALGSSGTTAVPGPTGFILLPLLVALGLIGGRTLRRRA